jgi:phosphopantothenoylcysteine decarboxylase/phosphopantothenate--cysteine ligase
MAAHSEAMAGGASPRSDRAAETSRDLDGIRIALCVTGSVAAFKAALIARLLLKEGAEVRTVLTRSAREFVGPATFSGITGLPPLGDMFEPGPGGESHVGLASSSELVLVAPATADVLARLVAGRADDLVTALCLCARCPVMVVPAMHPAMWSHPSTQRNMALLEADGRVERIGPLWGEVASGETGEGRMAEPEQVVARVKCRLWQKDLAERHLVITAGPTVEDLDPVRYLSNRSSGKTGFAVAERARLRGAKVTLITGPVKHDTPPGVQRIDVRSAVAMRGAVWQALGPDLSRADALVMAAAVADYRPAETHATKIHRDASNLTLEFVQNPDILAEVGHARRGDRPALVGFALETEPDDRLLASARRKLEEKGVDLVVANPARDSLEHDDSRTALVAWSGYEPLTLRSKRDLADHILDWLSARFSEVG